MKHRKLAENYAESQRKCRESRKLYMDHVLNGKRKLHFLLEQTSMSTWSCVNVFFQQASHFLRDIAVDSGKFSKEILSIKNNQNVAKELTKERRERLKKEMGASPPPSPSTGAFKDNIEDDFIILDDAPEGSSQPSATAASSLPPVAHPLDKLFD